MVVLCVSVLTTVKLADPASVGGGAELRGVERVLPAEVRGPLRLPGDGVAVVLLPRGLLPLVRRGP